MLITRQSMYSGITRTKDINVTDEQLKDYYERGLQLQAAFPHLSPTDREFIKTGITSEEWDSLFPEEEEEDNTDQYEVED